MRFAFYNVRSRNGNKSIKSSAFHLNFNFAEQVAGRKVGIHSPFGLGFLYFILLFSPCSSAKRDSQIFIHFRGEMEQKQQIKLHTKFCIGFFAEELFANFSLCLRSKRSRSVRCRLETNLSMTLQAHGPRSYAWWLGGEKLKFKSLCAININANLIQRGAERPSGVGSNFSARDGNL